MQKQLNKKGQVARQTSIVIGLGISLLILGGVVIGVQEFRDTLTNTTSGYEILNDTLTMFSNFGDQLGTVGTLLGVGLLIGVILGAFVVGRGLRERFA